MELFPLLALALLILLLGGALLLLVGRRAGPQQAVQPPVGVERMGYGRERWQRELVLWRGTLRRLEIQARYQPESEALQREMAEARARIAEAERQLERES